MAELRQLLGGVARGIFSTIRNWSRPPIPAEIDCQIGDYLLRVPVSHALPDVLRRYPAYASNVTRIAASINAKYADLTVIDIGANVGDTVAFIRAATSSPILCIEGCDTYLPYLKRNIAQFDHVELESSFIRFSDSNLRGTVSVSEGTARIVPTSGEVLHTLTLVEVLQLHPSFAKSKFLKIDTDGFDIPILRANRSAIEASRPIIFFEYDPFLYAGQPSDCSMVFEMLRELEYGQAVFYENTGDFLASVDLSEHSLLNDLHEFMVGRKGVRYWDICVFPREDADVCNELRASEIAFSRSSRLK